MYGLAFENNIMLRTQRHLPLARNCCGVEMRASPSEEEARSFFCATGRDPRGAI